MGQYALATLFLQFGLHLLWQLCFLNSESICFGYSVFKILTQSALATLFLKFWVNLLWLLCFSKILTQSALATLFFNSESICLGYFVFKIPIQSALATLFLKF
jgi:hypothetical protein